MDKGVPHHVTMENDLVSSLITVPYSPLCNFVIGFNPGPSHIVNMECHGKGDCGSKDGLEGIIQECFVE